MAKDRGVDGYVKPLLLMIVVFIVIMLVMVITAGLYLCSLLNTIDNPDIARSPYYEYVIKVRGIENFVAPGGEAVLYFPVPAYNGAPVLPFSGRLAQDFEQYGQGGSPYDSAIVNINPFGYHGTRYIEVVNTSRGLMLEAAVNDTDYREVDFRHVPKPVTSFDRMEIRVLNPIGRIGDKVTNTTLEGLNARPLYPDTGGQSTNYTRWIASENRTGYTSCVYVDEYLRALDANSTLEIYASIMIRIDDHPYGMNKGNVNYLYMINESIPGNVTGYIPVTVQYLGEFGSLDVHDVMEDFYSK